MFWSAAVLVIGALSFVFHAFQEKGTIMVSEDDLFIFVGAGVLFFVTLIPFNLMYSGGEPEVEYVG